MARPPAVPLLQAGPRPLGTPGRHWYQQGLVGAGYRLSGAFPPLPPAAFPTKDGHGVKLGVPRGTCPRHTWERAATERVTAATLPWLGDSHSLQP